LKDKTVIFIFIIATTGLLAWAGIGPWVSQWVAVSGHKYRFLIDEAESYRHQKMKERSEYVPLANVAEQ
jgi:hypothetical protein